MPIIQAELASQGHDVVTQMEGVELGWADDLCTGKERNRGRESDRLPLTLPPYLPHSQGSLALQWPDEAWMPRARSATDCRGKGRIQRARLVAWGDSPRGAPRKADPPPMRMTLSPI